MRILKQSHSAAKSERGTLSDFLTIILLQNSKKLGGPFGDTKKFQKFHSAEKNWKVGPFSLVRFCR